MCCCRFLSPIGAAIVCLLLFLIIRTLVLRRKDSTKWSFYVLPILLLVTVFINLFFIITKVHLGGGGSGRGVRGANWCNTSAKIDSVWRGVVPASSVCAGSSQSGRCPQLRVQALIRGMNATLFASFHH